MGWIYGQFGTYIRHRAKYNGPIPTRERWVIRFGSTEAYQWAKAKSVVRHLTSRCRSLLDRQNSEILQTGRTIDAKYSAIPADSREYLRSEIQMLLKCRAKWKKFLRNAAYAVDELLIGSMAFTTGAASV